MRFWLSFLSFCDVKSSTEVNSSVLHITSLPDDNVVCFTRHEPIGVCGAITPVSMVTFLDRSLHILPYSRVASGTSFWCLLIRSHWH